MKIFISGKISGLDRVEYLENFNKIERKLLAIGAKNIFNPAKEIDPGTSWTAAMEICYKEIETSDIVIFQHNWRDSIGARREFETAYSKCKMIHYDRESNYEDIRRELNKN
jgi:hypothetical protein